MRIFNIFAALSITSFVTSVRFLPLHIADIHSCSSLYTLIHPLKFNTNSTFNSDTQSLLTKKQFCKRNSGSPVLEPFSLSLNVKFPSSSDVVKFPVDPTTSFTYYFDSECITVIRDSVFHAAQCPTSPRCPHFTTHQLESSILGDTKLCLPVKHTLETHDLNDWKPITVVVNNDRLVKYPVFADLMIDRIHYKFTASSSPIVSNDFVVFCNGTDTHDEPQLCYITSRFCSLHTSPLNEMPEDFSYTIAGDYITFVHYPAGKDCRHSPLFPYKNLFDLELRAKILAYIPYTLDVTPDPVCHPSGKLLRYKTELLLTRRHSMRLTNMYTTDCDYVQWMQSPSYCNFHFNPVTKKIDRLHIPTLFESNKPGSYFSFVVTYIENLIIRFQKAIIDFIEPLIVRMDIAILEYLSKLIQLFSAEFSKIYAQLSPYIQKLLTLILEFVEKIVYLLFRILRDLIVQILDVILTPTDVSSTVITVLITFLLLLMKFTLYQSAFLSSALLTVLLIVESNFSPFNENYLQWQPKIN